MACNASIYDCEATRATFLHMFRSLASSAFLLLFVGCVRAPVSATDNATSGPPPGFQIGAVAPDFELPSLGGGSIRLSRLRGRAVVLNFWASWCGPCAEEMPALQALFATQGDRGPVVLAINQGEDAATVQAFVRAHGLTFPVGLDTDQRVGAQYRMIGLPTSTWIDANGRIADRVAGAMAPDVMQAKATRVVAVSESATAQVRTARGLTSSDSSQRVVATLGGNPLVREEDVDRRLDLLLALEQLDTGLVLDASRAADTAEIQQRRHLACRNLIDELLLVDAATNAGLEFDAAAVEAEIQRVAERAGSPEQLARDMRQHGVTIDELRNLFQRGALAQQYSEERVLSAETVGPPGEATRAWLELERTRRGVQVIDGACG